MSNNNNITTTSFDSSESGIFGDVLNGRAPVAPLKIGLLGLGYFEYWRMYPRLREIVCADLDGLFARLQTALHDCDLVYPGMVDTLDRAEAAGADFAAQHIDVIVVAEGTYTPDFITLHAINRAGGAPRIIMLNTQTGHDVAPDDDYMATMRNSALIGISQLTGSFRKMQKSYEVICGEIADPAIFDQINQQVKVWQAVKKLQSSTFGLIGNVFRGMYDLEFDKAKVKGFLGPEVMTIQSEHLLHIWRNITPDAARSAAGQLAKRFKTRNITADDLGNSCRLALALKELCFKYNLDGLCFLGQHYLEKMTGAPARLGASLLLESERVMTTCEGDIAGLVMMQLMYEFTGNIPLQAEWGQFDLRHNALFMLGHGIAAATLAQNDAAVTLTGAPEEWGFIGNGVNYEMIMKPGPVTMGHILNAGESWRMFISEGEAIDFPCLPCNEIHAMIKLTTPVQEYLTKVLRQGVAHHVIIVHGHVAGQLRQAAAAMRVEQFTI